jgi:hypothetical protein
VTLTDWLSPGLDGDLERLRDLLSPYLLKGDELHPLLSVLDLVRLDRDRAELLRARRDLPRSAGTLFSMDGHHAG